MHRKPFDWFAQELLTEALSGSGQTQPELKVTRNTQFIDLTFVPGPAHRKLRAGLGLLGQMTTEPCLIEPFHEAPVLAEVLECITKQLTLHHLHDLEAQKAGQPRPKTPWWLWVVSAGRPREAMAALKLEPMRGMPRGVYAGPLEGSPTGLVVVSELPVEHSTLLVRLLGAGTVLEQASRELEDLAGGGALWAAAERLVVELRVKVEQDPTLTDQEKEALIVATQTLIDNYNKKIEQGALQEGLRRGREEGREEGVALGQAAVVTVLRARGIEVGAKAAQRIKACTDAAELGRLLSQAATVKRAQELFAAKKGRGRSKKSPEH